MLLNTAFHGAKNWGWPMADSEVWELERKRMVAEQIEGRGIRNPRLLKAMRTVPRHEFIPLNVQDQAYSDGPLPIGYGQTISQPYIVALMTDLLHLKGDEKVLEIGTGSGYQAAILSQLARQVYTIERYIELAVQAEERLRELGYSNVVVVSGDGSRGLPEKAPYQAILVTAAAPTVPQALIDQLDVTGRIVIPVGDRNGQDLQVLEKAPEGISSYDIAPVAFVPMRGEFGWQEDEWENTSQ
jgi:protein-L-isoaspartate(D-aspartate) O-methyltransferase